MFRKSLLACLVVASVLAAPIGCRKVTKDNGDASPV